eukprot:scaffold225148_cov31-Prasinocladus_malaysianus.AAC.2
MFGQCVDVRSNVMSMIKAMTCSITAMKPAQPASSGRLSTWFVQLEDDKMLVSQGMSGTVAPASTRGVCSPA